MYTTYMVFDRKFPSENVTLNDSPWGHEFTSSLSIVLDGGCEVITILGGWMAREKDSPLVHMASKFAMSRTALDTFISGETIFLVETKLLTRYYYTCLITFFFSCPTCSETCGIMSPKWVLSF